MDMVRMVATAKHDYAGRHLVEGDEFDCEPQHVIVMETLGRGKKKADGKARNNYATRQMTARSAGNPKQ
jgi:hypothetical protein